MPRRESSIYAGQTIPRTRENEQNVWRNSPRAKRHPKYVHGKMGMAMMLHKVAYVEMRWWESDYSVFRRLVNPILCARTICGAYWRLEAGKAGTCSIPKPDAVLCGVCVGEGRRWPRGENNPAVTKRQAKDRLGCVVEGI
jgi:hypothetical protein